MSFLVAETGVGHLNSERSQPRDDTFRVLMVCTGNVARSPLAEQLFSARAAAAFQSDSANILVASAGVRALVGYDMTDDARRVARSHGVEAVRHHARQVTSELITAADLVLGANRAHRRFIVETQPRASSKAFTLVEFAHVLRWLGSGQGLVPPADLHESAAARLLSVRDAAARQRGMVPPPGDPSDFDIADPYGAKPAVYDQVGLRIAESVGTITETLQQLTRRTAVTAAPGG
jgi:low molecular weight protein-tyrosine phosphatase